MTSVTVAVTLANILIALTLSLGGAPILVWMERRVAGLIQDRPGPNRCHIAGFRLGGLVQSIADMLKLAFKEDFTPGHIKQKFYFTLAPAIVFICAFLTFMVMPVADTLYIDSKAYIMQALPIEFGVLWFLAFAGLSVYGVMLGGWASDNKYSILGGIRVSASMISYEASLSLALISILLVYGSVNLTEIAAFQGGLIFGFIPAWGVILQPLSAILFIVTAFAETNRAPFDMAEGESEIVGFHVEYSAMKFGLFFVGEYIAMCASSALIVTLFFGGYQIPWLDTQALRDNITPVLFALIILLPIMTFLFIGWMRRANRWAGKKVDARHHETKKLIWFLAITTAIVVIILATLALSNMSENGVNVTVAILQIITFSIKVFLMNFIYIVVRWTLPRFRYDQVQYLGWKILLPLALANIFVTALFVVGLS